MITPTVKRHVAIGPSCAFIALFISIVLFPPSLSAFTYPTEGKSVFDQFYQEDLLEVTLETNIEELLADKRSDTYYNGFLTFGEDEGSITHPVNVRMRGNYRRRVCDFPPLKFKFPEEYLETGGFNPRYRSLKLVTHCLEDKQEGKDNVLREFLAYKLFNVLSENSFRVQLVHITYIDRNDPDFREERYGFIIEDPDQVGDRMGAVECEQGCMNPAAADLDPKETTLVALFQYMIGNADWNIRMMRNLKLMTHGDDRGHIPVPYDFDFAGLIDAEYAIPNNDHELGNIRERVYLGIPVDDAIMKWALKYMEFKRKDLLQTVKDFKYLKARSRTDILSYLQTFFTYVDRLDVSSTANLYQQISSKKLSYPPPFMGP